MRSLKMIVKVVVWIALGLLPTWAIWTEWGAIKQMPWWLLSTFPAGLIIALVAIVRFTIVHEGTSRAITVFGKFSKIIFQWERHWMDKDWSIWKESEGDDDRKKLEKRVFGRILGGLYIYFWPFQRIHRYKHRWSDIRLRENGKMDVEFHEEENFDHVLLKPAVYAFKLFAVETKPPERIPVDVLILITLRVQNPYLFLFVAPPTPIEDVLARVGAEMRAIITSCFIDDLLQLKGESLWVEKGRKRPLLKGAKVINDTLQKWGLKLADKGIEIRDINFPPAYQKAAAAKKEEGLKAIGRAEEIAGTVISAVARAEGKKEEDVQAEFTADPEAFCKKHQWIIDNTMTKLSMEERAYLRIETPGATGFGGEFARLIATALRMPMVGGEKKGEERAEKEEKEGVGGVKRRGSRGEDLKRRLKRGEDITQDLEDFTKEVLEEEEE